MIIALHRHVDWCQIAESRIEERISPHKSACVYAIGSQLAKIDWPMRVSRVNPAG